MEASPQGLTASARRADGTAPARAALRITFAVYVLASGSTMARHELTSDEIHSWNIVKASATVADLIHNSRYEGHPPGWYMLLWPLTRVTRDPVSMQVLHGAIASCVAYLVLFRSPLPLVARLLVPFGYFFLFEYAVLSRNYAIGVLLGLGISVLLGKKDREGTPLYYLLLLLLSTAHLLAAILAGSLHLAVLVRMRQRGRAPGAIVGHLVLGALVLLPSAWFIFPPADSALNAASWLDKWTPQQVRALAQAPLRSFLPVPAWWNQNFWNTQMLLEARIRHPALRLLNPLVAVLVLGSAFFVLRKHRASALLFAANLGVTFLIAAIALPLTAARYSGFLYIGFLLAFWLRCGEEPGLTRGEAVVVYGLLAVQVAGGVFAAWKDLRLPFTNLPRIVELAGEVPSDSRLVTDYWTMNAYSAFVDKPIFCVDMRRDLSFVLFDRSLAEALKSGARYSGGLREIFRRDGPKAVYMVSLSSLPKLGRADRDLEQAFRVVVVDRREGAIDRNGDLYLYRITPR